MEQPAPRPRSSGNDNTTYTIHERKGKRIIAFACPRCQSPLESPLEEAGQTFPCPTCGTHVTTPGLKEFREQQARETAARAAAEGRRAEEAQREQAKRDVELKSAAERASRERQRHEEDEAARAARPRAHVTPRELALACIGTAIVLYLSSVLPLQMKLRETQERLTTLIQTVDHNADTAAQNLAALGAVVSTNAEVVNKNTAAVSIDLHALNDVVNVNATTANKNTTAVASDLRELSNVVNAISDDLRSLAHTVSYNADVANSNNRRW
jgi:uncharacterized Zn finger protein (UPF0148 family)